MADNYVSVNSAPAGDTKMQTYLNTLGANDVHAEAVVLVNSAGGPITTLPVSIGANVTVAGTVAATQSGDWIVKSPNASNFLAAVTATQGGIWNIGSISSNVNVADAGGSLTVDGTVAATQSGTWNIGTINNLTVNAGTNFNLGGASMFNGQINVSTTPATLVSARATRRSVSIRHIGTTTNMYIGSPVISSGNGMLLRFGDSISVDYVGLIQIVSSANGTNNNVAYLETYD